MLKFFSRITKLAVGIFIEIQEIAFLVGNEDAVRRLFEDNPVEIGTLQIIFPSRAEILSYSHLFFNLYG